MPNGAAQESFRTGKRCHTETPAGLLWRALLPVISKFPWQPPVEPDLVNPIARLIPLLLWHLSLLPSGFSDWVWFFFPGHLHPSRIVTVSQCLTFSEFSASQWLILRWKCVTSKVPAKRFTSQLLFASVTLILKTNIWEIQCCVRNLLPSVNSCSQSPGNKLLMVVNHKSEFCFISLVLPLTPDLPLK